jgi:hypothetical protein
MRKKVMINQEPQINQREQTKEEGYQDVRVYRSQTNSVSHDDLQTFIGELKDWL